jgi:endoglucanase
MTDLHLDIGASSREEAEALVRVGDAGVWGGVPTELPNGRLLSKALDNRLGAYVALESARRIGEAGAKVDAVAVAAVQEELGTYGARAAAFGLAPDLAIVVDVTPATDVPGGIPQRAGAIDLGMGAMIARGPTLNKKLSDLLSETAADEGIAHGFEVYSRETHTDADDFHNARAGIPTGLLSVPTRYVHSPNELCDLADVEAVIALIVALAKRVTKETSFVR